MFTPNNSLFLELLLKIYIAFFILQKKVVSQVETHNVVTQFPRLQLLQVLQEQNIGHMLVNLFLLLWQNTQDKQLKKRKISLGS